MSNVTSDPIVRVAGGLMAAKALALGEGLRLQSGPGRDLIFKVTG
jgi:hypothetical protein